MGSFVIFPNYFQFLFYDILGFLFRKSPIDISQKFVGVKTENILRIIYFYCLFLGAKARLGHIKGSID